MAFNQDDARERAMVLALGLAQRPDRRRHDEDGHLDLVWQAHNVRLLFECKSTTEDGDFGTGRDTGLPQLARWATMHFAFGTFEARDNEPKRMWYASPRAMYTWNKAEVEYLKPDLMLLDKAPALVTGDLVDQIFGPGDVYTFAQMRAVMKDQWNASVAANRANQYRAQAMNPQVKAASDLVYERATAVQALKDRMRYLVARGATVNNRKISRAYVRQNAVELQFPWAQSLTNAVRFEMELKDSPN